MIEQKSNSGGNRLPFFRASDLVWVLGLFVTFAIIAVNLPPDGTPDFKIYHFYNGYSQHFDRTKLDIFPAHLQTAFYPGLDAIYYSIFEALNSTPRLLNVVLSLPYGAASTAIFLFVRLFLQFQFPWRNVVAALTAIGALTGAAVLPTIATTMSEVPPTLPFLIGLVFWSKLEADEQTTIGKTIAIGALGGLTVGLKLTTAPLFVGLFLAMLFAGNAKGGLRLGRALAFGMAGMIVFFAVDFFWLWKNWTLYGNPIFPLMNQYFRSDLVDHSPSTDLRFMPKTVLMELIYPAFWAFDLSHDAIELNMRDARILVGCLCSLIIIWVNVRDRWRVKDHRLDAPNLRIGFAIAVMYLVAYILWEEIWSIYRYLAVLEMLSIPMLLLAFLFVGGSDFRLVWRLAAFVLVTTAIMTTTAYPWWSRAQPGPEARTVNLPAIEGDAMVVFLDGYAYSYLVPSMPKSVRAIAANSNLVRPDSKGLLEQRIEQEISMHPGPLWGFEDPADFPGIAEITLAKHHLQRAGTCTFLDSSIEEKSAVRICQLKRTP